MAEKKEKPKKGTTAKSIVLAIVIAIVLFAFVALLIETIHPHPKFEDYCNVKVPRINNVSQENQKFCEEQGGTWENGWCDYYSNCRQDFDKARGLYNLEVFLISVIVGITAIIAGIFLVLPSVSLGLMLGGLLLVIYGVARYWGNMSNVIRTIILGIALIILIWLAYKKLKA